MAKPKKKGRPARRALSAEREREVVRDFMAGVPQTELAERYGVGLNTIARTLRRHGAFADMRNTDRKTGKADPSAIDSFAALGSPPTSQPLEAAAWLHRLLVTAVSRASLDPELNEKQRRREIAQLARAAVAAFPFALVEEAQRLIGEEQAKLTNDAGPETVPAEGLDGPKRSVGV